MDWLNEKLKDKKNLPIVVGIAVFFVLAAAGLIAFELGLFPAGTTTASTPPGIPPVPPPGSLPPGGPGGLPPSARSGSLPPGPGSSNPFSNGRIPTAATGLAGVPGVNEARPGTTAPNPAGPNPYVIPNGRQLLAQRNGPVVGNPALRDRLPRVDLYRFRAPAAVLPSVNPYNTGQNTQVLAAAYRLSGIVNGPDGNINGILEVGGQSQTVKPGDTLPDGSTVESITGTGLILRTPGGTPITISVSNGSDGPPNGPGYPGQGFPGQGYPGQGYPGQGYPGQGYPGQGFPGQGNPGGGNPGFPGGGNPGFPGPGDTGGGADFGDNG